MPRPKKPARNKDLARVKKKAFDCLKLSLETTNPHEAATARKMAERIAAKHGFNLAQLLNTIIEERAAHEVRPKPARPIAKKRTAKAAPVLKWKELELLRSAYILVTGEPVTPGAFERNLSKLAAKITDFLETVRER